MTTIATDGKVMAGDGARFRNEIMVGRATRKVQRLPDGSILGCSGAVPDIIAFQEWIKSGANGKRPKSDDTLNALHLRADGLFYYSTKGAAARAESPAAIGSGAELALGALLSGASPGDAVSIAAQRDPYTGGEIISLALDGEAGDLPRLSPARTSMGSDRG